MSSGFGCLLIRVAFFTSSYIFIYIHFDEIKSVLIQEISSRTDSRLTRVKWNNKIFPVLLSLFYSILYLISVNVFPSHRSVTRKRFHLNESLIFIQANMNH